MTGSSCNLLVVDDNPAIHEDMKKILLGERKAGAPWSALEAEFFGDESPATPEEGAQEIHFVLQSAFQGEDGVERVVTALREQNPFAVAIVDARMPPGMNGVDAIAQMQEADPNLQVVLCTAYSDHSWWEIRSRLGNKNGFMILKKPFDSIELLQLTQALARKWFLERQVEQHMYQLQTLLDDRTQALDQANQELRRRVRDLERMETELRTAQKMEAVGQLAAGIAHEINTPVQFASDGVYFLHSVFESFAELLPRYRGLCERLAGVPGFEEPLAGVLRAEEEIDLPFLLENLPPAFARAFEGLDRVANIVKAMKDFAHPGGGEKDYADLNQAINSTLTVAKGEYKHVATVETELEDLPPILCHIGDLNQALLNLVVNAAHAIESRQQRQPGQGCIRIRTRLLDGDTVEVTVADNGCGIPENIRHRIFEPFFTTKEVGKGSGQGLAMVYGSVVEKHGGEIQVQSDEQRGTCFTIRLPVQAPEQSVAALAS